MEMINFNTPLDWDQNFKKLELNKHFSKKTSKTKKDWYKKYLRQRILKKYRVEIFNGLIDYMDQELSLKIEKTISSFVDTKEVLLYV